MSSSKERSITTRSEEDQEAILNKELSRQDPTGAKELAEALKIIGDSFLGSTKCCGTGTCG